MSFGTKTFASVEAVENAIMACQALESITLSLDDAQIDGDKSGKTCSSDLQTLETHLLSYVFTF
jgi:hypothetical protein